MRVVVYATEKGNKRGEHIARACVEGLQTCGVDVLFERSFDGHAKGDVAIAYGWTHKPVFDVYPHFVFWDLGYWGRRSREGIDGEYHRFSIDDWDTAESIVPGKPSDRWKRLGVDVKPWVSDAYNRNYILLAGMSGKAARTHGYEPGVWETQHAEILRKQGFNVILRKKPNKRTIVQGTIQEALIDAQLLVTHHSNVALDALVEGLPIYTIKGVARRLSSQSIEPLMIFNPSKASRLQLFQDVAYCQWTMREVKNGDWWQYVQNAYALGEPKSRYRGQSAS